jgi:RNA polymerase sigma-70 factor, ECF subfamily
MSTAAPGCYSYENSIATFLDQATYHVLLRRAAGILQREPRGHLFEPADLVHDSVLRIARTAVPVRFHSTDHLVALATIVMRRVIVDYRRSARSAKRRSSAPLAGESLGAPGAVDTIIVRDALARLAPRGDRIFRIVEMRFFDGFDIDEIASALDISSRTVKRDWSAARERLHGLLRG